MRLKNKMKIAIIISIFSLYYLSFNHNNNVNAFDYNDCIERPEWWDSEYIIKEIGNVHILDNAPDDLKLKFKLFLKEVKSNSY